MYFYLYYCFIYIRVKLFFQENIEMYQSYFRFVTWHYPRGLHDLTDK